MAKIFSDGFDFLYVNNTSFWELPPPLNVDCPVCRAPIGIECRAPKKFPLRWKKGKGQKGKWFAGKDKETLPHKKRIDASKVQEVVDALDGEN